jgi:DNA-binding Xre family transcriptional regulator
VEKMAISYKKLWKLLIDRDMIKKDLREAAGISTASMAKLGKNANVTTDVLVSICEALNCDISDIMEIVPDRKSVNSKAEVSGER